MPLFSAIKESEEGRKKFVHLEDHPGHFNFRSQLMTSLDLAKTILVVVDSKEKSQSEAANILYEVLNNVNALDDAIHILIACNKQDLPFPRRATEIERDLMGEIE